jgi:hypothetical protein
MSGTVYIVMDAVLALLRPGKTVWVFRERWHVRAIVDNTHVVCRRWFRHQQRWDYVVKEIFHFQLIYNLGGLRPISAPRPERAYPPVEPPWG